MSVVLPAHRDPGVVVGRISANAASPVWNQGGSSGGSVWITTGTLTGNWWRGVWLPCLWFVVRLSPNECCALCR